MKAFRYSMRYDLIVFFFYVMTGTYQKDSVYNYRLIADRSSIAIDWGDEWHERIRRFQKRQLKGKCKSEMDSDS